jgi:hypothetical protein
MLVDIQQEGAFWQGKYKALLMAELSILFKVIPMTADKTDKAFLRLFLQANRFVVLLSIKPC